MLPLELSHSTGAMAGVKQVRGEKSRWLVRLRLMSLLLPCYWPKEAPQLGLPSSGREKTVLLCDGRKRELKCLWTPPAYRRREGTHLSPMYVPFLPSNHGHVSRHAELHLVYRKRMPTLSCLDWNTHSQGQQSLCESKTDPNSINFFTLDPFFIS